MGKPDDIPADVWSAARGCFCVKEITPGEAPLTVDRIARAILAERERCVSIACGVFPAESEGRKIPYKTQQISHWCGNAIALALRGEPLQAKE